MQANSGQRRNYRNRENPERQERETETVSECVCLKLKSKEVDDAGGNMAIARCNVTCVAELLLQTAFKIKYKRRQVVLSKMELD